MALNQTAKSKQPTHHRKSKGDHHRRSKHYLTIYHPYLPLLLLVVVGLAINFFWSSRPAVLGASTNLTAATLLESTNIERSKTQSGDLRLNTELRAAAQAKAEDMAAKDYWTHDTPEGQQPWAFIEASGYKYQAAGENLAYGFSSAPTTIYGWMNSKQHRSNMLNPVYSDVGFGIASAADYQGQGPTTIIVALYGQPSETSMTSGLLGASTTGSFNAAPMQSVSRIQLLTNGSAPWSFTLAMLLSFAALLLFIYRHARIWHKVLVKSESFVVHHKALDVVIVTYSIAGFILTRAAGYIH